MAHIINSVSPTVSKEVRCDVCSLMVSSYVRFVVISIVASHINLIDFQVVLKDHREGRKHMNQLKLLVRGKNINLNCLICSHLSRNYNEWELHVTSEKHVEAVKQYMPIHAASIPHPTQSEPPQTSIIPPLIPSKELEELTAKLQASINQQLNDKALKQIVAKNRKEWNCINCKVTCQSICSWEAHLASHKHRKNRHKFHTYPGVSRELVKKKYQNSFVRAAETLGEHQNSYM